MSKEASDRTKEDLKVRTRKNERKSRHLPMHRGMQVSKVGLVAVIAKFSGVISIMMH